MSWKTRFVVVMALLVAGCGGGGDGDAEPAQPTQAEQPEAGEAVIETTVSVATTTQATSAPTTTQAPEQAPEPEPEPETGDGVGRALLTVGDNTWSFDRVDLCTTSRQSDETASFVMVGKHGELQLVARVHDPTGGQRLEGEGVWGYIDFLDLADTSVAWRADGEPGSEQFIVVNGLSVTASAMFTDMTGIEPEPVAGTLEVTCP